MSVPCVCIYKRIIKHVARKMVKLPFLKCKTYDDDDVRKRSARLLLKHNCTGVVDSLIRLYLMTDQRYQISSMLIGLLNGKYGQVRCRYRMSIHLRVAICAITVHHDKSCAMYHIQKARLIVSKHKHTQFEIVLFYSLLAWANIAGGDSAKGIICLNHVQRVATDTDISTVGILNRVCKCLMLICKLTSGLIIDSIDNLVSLNDVGERVMLNTIYECINAGFYVECNRYKATQYPLFLEFAKSYILLENPLCCTYDISKPGNVTDCINEFICVYTNEACKYSFTEEDIVALENKYKKVFNRKTLKFNL